MHRKHKKLIIPQTSEETLSTYSHPGNQQFILNYLIFLTLKHKSLCSILPPLNTIKNSGFASISDYTLQWVIMPSDKELPPEKQGWLKHYTKSELYLPNNKNWETIFNACMSNDNIKFIIIYLSIIGNIYENEPIDHMNMLIFNKDKKYAFRYEPAGSSVTHTHLDDALSKFVGKYSGFRFINTNQSCIYK